MIQVHERVVTCSGSPFYGVVAYAGRQAHCIQVDSSHAQVVTQITECTATEICSGESATPVITHIVEDARRPLSGVAIHHAVADHTSPM